MRLRDAIEEFKDRRLIDTKGGETLIRSINLFLTDDKRLTVNSRFEDVTDVLNHITDEQREILLDLHVDTQLGSVIKGIAFLIAMSMFIITLSLTTLLEIDDPNNSEEDKAQVIETITAILELLFK